MRFVREVRRNELQNSFQFKIITDDSSTSNPPDLLNFATTSIRQLTGRRLQPNLHDQLYFLESTNHCPFLYRRQKLIEQISLLYSTGPFVDLTDQS